MLPKNLNGEFKNTVPGIASETYSCTALPIQMAACAAYQWSQTVQQYLFHQRRLKAFIGNWTVQKLKGAGVRVHLPEGGFYLFLDFSPFSSRLQKKGIITSDMLCKRLLADIGVVLLPGDAFGLSPTYLSARMAYVDFDGKNALEASELVGQKSPLKEALLNTVFAKTARGIMLLCGWLVAL